MQLQATVSVAGQQISVREIYIKGLLYLSTSGLDKAVTGKSWVLMDLSSLQSGGGQTPSLGAMGTTRRPLSNCSRNTAMLLSPSARRQSTESQCGVSERRSIRRRSEIA
jgi:hypothetical protein